MTDEYENERLFFALWPPAELAERMRLIGDELSIAGRRLPAANLHITLAFLGDVATERVDELLTIGDELPRPVFTLHLDRVGHWHRPRVTWLAPSETPQAAIDLYEALQSALRAAELPTTDRPFRPHITLARKSRPPPVRSIEPVVWPVTRLLLVASQLGPQGSEYVTRGEWQLPFAQGV